jgi:hypothetical protein
MVDGTAPELIEYGRKFARRAQDQTVLPDAIIPKEIAARDRDNLRPILRMAELFTEEWRQRARQAAIEINGVTRPIGAIVPLLTDIQRVFGTREWMTTKEMGQQLLALDEPSADWSAINKGREINGYYLREQLKGLIDPPEKERRGTGGRGYLRKHFDNAFARYLLAGRREDGSTSPEPDPADGKHFTSPPDDAARAPEGGLGKATSGGVAESSDLVAPSDPQPPPVVASDESITRTGVQGAESQIHIFSSLGASVGSDRSGKELKSHNNLLPDQNLASDRPPAIRQDDPAKDQDASSSAYVPDAQPLSDARSLPDAKFRSDIRNIHDINALSDMPDRTDAPQSSEAIITSPVAASAVVDTAIWLPENDSPDAAIAVPETGSITASLAASSHPASIVQPASTDAGDAVPEASSGDGLDLSKPSAGRNGAAPRASALRARARAKVKAGTKPKKDGLDEARREILTYHSKHPEKTAEQIANGVQRALSFVKKVLAGHAIDEQLNGGSRD